MMVSILLGVLSKENAEAEVAVREKMGSRRG